MSYPFPAPIKCTQSLQNLTFYSKFPPLSLSMAILMILFFLFSQIAHAAADDSSDDDSSEVSIAGESSLDSELPVPESKELNSAEESIKDFVHSVFQANARGSDQACTSYQCTSEITPGFGWVDILAVARAGLVSAAPSPAPGPPAHLAPVPQGIPKTRLCRDWSEGRECPLGDGCGFAHGPDELVEVDRLPGYRTQPCVVFHTGGNCEFGDKCHFLL